MTGRAVRTTSRERCGSTVVALVVVLSADLLYLFTVVLPLVLTDPDGARAAVDGVWPGLPAYLLVFSLPLVLFGAVLLTVRTGPGRACAAVRTTVAVLAAAGFAMYVSPWGRAGVAALLES